MTRNIYVVILVLISILLNINFSKCCIAQSAQGNMPVATMPDIPRNLPLLALSRTNLDTNLTKAGDTFAAKLAEDLVLQNVVLVPKDSSVYGIVTSVKKPKRYPLKNGSIEIAINMLETPQGQKISLERREILGKIISPLERTIKRKVVGTVPPRAAGYGTTIPLGRSTDLNSGVVYAIGMGASIAAGAASGFIVPDIGRSRIRSSFERAVDSTPIGAVRGFVAKGQDVGLRIGDGLIINFDNRALQLIRSQQIAQNITPTVVVQK